MDDATNDAATPNMNRMVYLNASHVPGYRPGYQYLFYNICEEISIIWHNYARLSRLSFYRFRDILVRRREQLEMWGKRRKVQRAVAAALAKRAEERVQQERIRREMASAFEANRADIIFELGEGTEMLGELEEVPEQQEEEEDQEDQEEEEEEEELVWVNLLVWDDVGHYLMLKKLFEQPGIELHDPPFDFQRLEEDAIFTPDNHAGLRKGCCVYFRQPHSIWERMLWCLQNTTVVKHLPVRLLIFDASLPRSRPFVGEDASIG